VCAVTAVAGGVLASAPVSAQAPDARSSSAATPNMSVAVPAPVSGNGVTLRAGRKTGLKVKIVGVTAGGRASVKVTGPKQSTGKKGKKYSRVIHRSMTLKVRPGKYKVRALTVAATGGRDVPAVATKKLRVRKNKLTRFTVRYTLVTTCSGLAVGGTGPGGGKVFFKDMTRAPGSQCMEAVVASTLPAWSDNAGSFYQWCVGTGQTNNVVTGTGIGAGKVNTDNMVAACTSGAANSVRDYTGGLGAGTWSLPSLDELNALDVSGVGGLTGFSYWSSSQYDASRAWAQAVGSGGGSGWQFTNNKLDSTIHVRPVRAF